MLTQTFRCINFCSGSYHSSSTRPDGTAPHRKVLSVYGFLAGRERREEVSAAAAAAAGTEMNSTELDWT